MKKILYIIINLLLLNTYVFASSTDLSIDKYTEKANQFLYKNTDLFRIDKNNIYFNISTLQNIKPTYNTTNIDFIIQDEVKKDIRFGGLFEYKFINDVNNFKLGFVMGYKNLDSYIAYRFAKNGKFLNHNIDLFAKYVHKYDIKKVNIDPSISLFATYSSKIYLEDDYLIYDRLAYGVNIAANISYEVMKNLSIVSSPSIEISYQDQEIKKDKKFTLLNNSYFDYNLDFGVKYTKSKFTILPKLKLSGDMKGNVKLGFDFTTEYKF